jgi:hypothetical protein
MQALIKKGTESYPVWGSIRFQPNGWVFLPESDKPHLFNDGTTKEGIQSLFLPNKELEYYEMIPVTVIPQI